MSDIHWKAYFWINMRLWPKSWSGRVVLATDAWGYSAIILGALTSSLVLSVRSPESNALNRISVSVEPSSPHSPPEGEISLPALIGFTWCDVALAVFAQLVGPDVDVWPRLDKIEDLLRDSGIGVEVPVSIRTACLQAGSTCPWVVVWSCFHQVGWRSEKPRKRRERWRLGEKRKKWTLVEGGSDENRERTDGILSLPSNLLPRPLESVLYLNNKRWVFGLH